MAQRAMLGNSGRVRSAHLNLGEPVQVVGREKTQSFVTADGVMKQKTVFLIREFLTGSVGSESTPSRDTRSGII